MKILLCFVMLAVMAAIPGEGETIDIMERLYRGEEVHDREGLEAYTGENAVSVIEGEDRKLVYALNYVQLGLNYGEAVEYQLRREAVVLCPQTADFLYGEEFTPREARYVRGSRPQLEKTVNEITEGMDSEREKALAIMRFCRDLHKERKLSWDQSIFGGTEEQLIARGEILCETVSRLAVALWEVAGLPGRIILHVGGGHYTAEVQVEGRWAYMDPRFGIYFLNSEGEFASLWEIWHQPGIIHEQSEEVKSEVVEYSTWEERVSRCERFFDPREINMLINYSLADSSGYSYSLRSHHEAKEAGLSVINNEYRKAMERVFESEP